jgi:hypothetical protein
MIEPDWTKLHTWHLEGKLSLLGLFAARAIRDNDHERLRQIRKESDYIAHILKIRTNEKRNSNTV